MNRRILFVDDEPNVLQAIERQFRKKYAICTAIGADAGLRLMMEGAFAVVVSDMRMPGMNGVQFLTRVRQNWPDTVRLMLTGQAEFTDAIAAVNEGNIFQFLTKPCPAEMLERALETALKQHDLIIAERELLENTLSGSVEVLSDILSLVNPPAFGRARRLRGYVRHMCEAMNLPAKWQYEIAAMLSQIGCVTVPPQVLEKVTAHKPLSAEEEKIFAAHSMVAHNLLVKIPRLATVAKIIAAQRSHSVFQQAGGTNLAMGIQMLSAALDFDEHLEAGKSVTAALEAVRRRDYDPACLRALEALETPSAARGLHHLKVAELRPGMVTNADVRSATGILLLAKGFEITESALVCLQSFVSTVGVIEPISVTIR
jgi:CheY-like chemotaxis protein